MRILHILRNVNNLGNGVINAGVELACVQSKLGATVAMASAGGDYEKLLTENDVRHFQLVHGGMPPLTLKSCRQFRAIVDEFNPDIVHGHVVYGVLLAWLLRGSKRFRLISHIHNVEKKRTQLLRLGDATIAVSSAVAADMRNRRFPSSRLFVVQNRFVGSLRALNATPTKNVVLQQPAIVTVAGMSKRKNIDGLIGAFSMIADDFPNAHLYLVGDGPDREEFVRMAALLPVSQRIHFEGFQKDPRPYVQSAHIFVLASHRDSSPLVIHEAREFGTAIIATHVDGIPEALDHGKAGLLVSPGDVNALAEALRRVLSNTAEHGRLQQAARQGLAMHSVWRMGRETLSVYRAVLEGRSPQEPADTTEAIQEA